MTTFLHPRGKTWRYDFWWTNPNTGISTRYTGTTGQLTKDAADIVETQIKQRVREQAFGIATFDRTQTPTFQTWAQQHLLYVAQKKRIRRIDFAKATLRLVLQFWGSVHRNFRMSRRPLRSGAHRSPPHEPESNPRRITTSASSTRSPSLSG